MHLKKVKYPKLLKLMNYRRLLVARNTYVWIWTVVNHWQPGIILWTIGDQLRWLPKADRSSQTCSNLWLIIKCWHSFWYVSDGYPVYPCFIEPEDHLVSKTYMTRVEGENTRLRHYLARLHRKSGKTPRRRQAQGNACQDTLCYSKSLEMLKHSIRLLLHYLKFKTIHAIT